MARDTMLQLRLDADMKRAFTEAAERERMTPSKAMRDLIIDFVRTSQRKEAERQSRLVAAASDARETMDDLARAQDWIDE